MRQIKNNRGKVLFEQFTDVCDQELVQEALKADCSLKHANFNGLMLDGIDFSGKELTGANFSNTRLVGVNFKGARLINAKFKGAVLDNVNFNRAVLSGATGLPTAKEYLQQFKSVRAGIYVYKKIFETTYAMPKHWNIKPGEYLTETVNPDRGTECGSGVNFATKEWLEGRYERSKTQLWLCLIEWPDVADVVVPYCTDGKARCSRLKLVKRLK